MTTPALVLGLVIACLIGSLFHVFVGGGFGRLLLYLLLSLMGFALGEWVGSMRNWILFPVGTLNLGVGIIGSVILLVGGHWISLVKIGPNNGDDAV